MKFAWNERIKHRIVGSIVILSIAALFVPTIIKQPNERFDKLLHVSTRLPKKPELPRVVIPSKKAMFKTVEKSKEAVPVVVIKPVPSFTDPSLLQSSITPIGKELLVAQTHVISHSASQQLLKQIALKDIKKQVYGVQVATFLQEKNANILIKSLHAKGYQATHVKGSNKAGRVYRVIVGAVNLPEEAKILQKKLATNTKLRGFVVKREIG